MEYETTLLQAVRDPLDLNELVRAYNNEKDINELIPLLLDNTARTNILYIVLESRKITPEMVVALGKIDRRVLSEEDRTYIEFIVESKKTAFSA